MDPGTSGRRRFRAWFPRTRGDGPRAAVPNPKGSRVSPHTRGWTQDGRRHPVRVPGFPAHAGMDPAASRRQRRPGRFPRTRGDGPAVYRSQDDGVTVSPHTRGWTQKTSPRRRPRQGFPAHAGMDPRLADRGRTGGRFPRTRGDGPLAIRHRERQPAVSPHTRGWTPCRVRPLGEGAGFPAHAGMDPRVRRGCSAATWFPRTRGDGPWRWRSSLTGRPVSPHTRGWTPACRTARSISSGFPAHAGMDPIDPSAPRRARWFPRTRGDGPAR